MTLLVTEIKFDYTANTNPFHAPITEVGKHLIESEETYGWYVETVKFEEAK